LVQPKTGTVGALEFPSLVHRLDAPTSGLLVVAKTRPAAVNISKQFATRQVKKTYTALLQGTLTEQHGRIDSPIDDKPAVTEWNVIREFRSTKSPLTLVTFRPLHGRKHQLRRHAVRMIVVHV
jgi:23S rRNA-/tRNA-specific pseudouridylate synthase